MTTEEITSLLDKFYEAKTTPGEEDRLKAYFLNTDVPADMEADRQLFCELAAHDGAVPEGLEARMNRNIDRWNTVEKGAGRRARTVTLRWIAGMAASLLVLVSLGTYFGQQQRRAGAYAESKETYDNPKDAAGETERALTKFSIAINKGLHKMNNYKTTD